MANKCDGSIDEYSHNIETVEQSVRELMDEWKGKRSLGDQYRRNMTNFSWISGRNLVSCRDFSGFSELVKRILDFGCTSIEVPPSWDLALAVVNALRKTEPPVAAAIDHLGLRTTPTDTDKSGEWAHNLITRHDLSLKWQGVLNWIKPELEAHKGQLVALSNPEGALEGALWIRWDICTYLGTLLVRNFNSSAPQRQSRNTGDYSTPLHFAIVTALTITSIAIRFMTKEEF